MRTKPFQNTGRTWFKKGRTPWNKGMIGWTPKKKTGKTIICKVCGKEKYFELNQLLRRPCLYCSVKCARMSEKKDLTVYSSIHSKIKRMWGKANKCDFCGNNATIDWANKDGRYLLERGNWLKLCRKCHIHYDKNRRLQVNNLI